MIYPITLYGDPILKKSAQDIVPDQNDLSELVADMFETMSHANGVGLAAPQIGKSLRIFVVDSTPMKAPEEPIKSGLRQVRRGLLEGPRGAISHFEKSWHSEDQWLTAMSHAALVLIHRHMGDTENEENHDLELEKLGGWDSVDESWTGAIRDGLSQL